MTPTAGPKTVPPGNRERRLRTLISRFSRVQLLVIGDLMLDQFIWGRVERISPEAPVPVVQVTRESFHLGGAANVVHNIRALGGRATVAASSGVTAPGSRVLGELKRIGAGTAGVATSGQRGHRPQDPDHRAQPAGGALRSRAQRSRQHGARAVLRAFSSGICGISTRWSYRTTARGSSIAELLAVLQRGARAAPVPPHRRSQEAELRALLWAHPGDAQPARSRRCRRHRRSATPAACARPATVCSSAGRPKRS